MSEAIVDALDARYILKSDDTAPADLVFRLTTTRPDYQFGAADGTTPVASAGRARYVRDAALKSEDAGVGHSAANPLDGRSYGSGDTTGMLYRLGRAPNGLGSWTIAHGYLEAPQLVSPPPATDTSGNLLPFTLVAMLGIVAYDAGAQTPNLCAVLGSGNQVTPVAGTDGTHAPVLSLRVDGVGWVPSVTSLSVLDTTAYGSTNLTPTSGFGGGPWHVVAWVWDGHTMVVRTFGASNFAPVTLSMAGLAFAASRTWNMVGTQNSDYTWPLKHDLAEIALYSTARTDVQALATTMAARFGGEVTP